jgi:hypothetical protein
MHVPIARRRDGAVLAVLALTSGLVRFSAHR